MNNSLIIGETITSNKGTVIKDPFSMIPMEEGLRLIPLDIDLIGVKIPELILTEDKVFYTITPSEVIIQEYEKLLKGETPPVPEAEKTEETEKTETEK